MAMSDQLIKQFDNRYDRYLRDESSENGWADSISVPQSEEEVCSVMRELASAGETRITVQGGLTGLSGRAVPHGGHILSLSGLDRVIDSGTDEGRQRYITVQAGITLAALDAELAKRFRSESLCWPPSPSEDSATVGGTAVSAAFGIDGAGAGGCGRYISGLTYVNMAGEPEGINDEEDIAGFLGGSHHDSGCPVVRLTLRLEPAANEKWGVAFFFTDPENAAACTGAIEVKRAVCAADVPVIELITRPALDAAMSAKDTMGAAWTVPDLPDGVTDILYIEAAGTEEEIEETVMELSETAAGYGSDIENAWALSGDAEISRMHLLRHAVTEGAASIMAGIHAGNESLHILAADIRLGRDLSMGLGEEIMSVRSLIESSGVSWTMCCSASVPCARILLMPGNTEEYERAQTIVRRWKEEGASI